MDPGDVVVEVVLGGEQVAALLAHVLVAPGEVNVLYVLLQVAPVARHFAAHRTGEPAQTRHDVTTEVQRVQT